MSDAHLAHEVLAVLVAEAPARGMQVLLLDGGDVQITYKEAVRVWELRSNLSNRFVRVLSRFYGIPIELFWAKQVPVPVEATPAPRAIQ